MAAMHWEARRRQGMVDRMTREKNQPLRVAPESKATEELKTADQKQAQSHCPHCHASLQQTAPVQYSARIPNRYNSTQYNQQW